ncbi:glucose-6-phosphate isomerase [Intrasporangium calvum]|uniref:Glucose-6-phosphate isomerase n=1 Tax=Intrasporangium calvum (strain ATCC 23552 / DSM 43043 / JCM 3097 / NBRC 12989 / NCIMB 10167 / NRRL B-3866 / 7 KIP) TaxID=710696 RepID=E6S9K9_INTC7|nr:glucose-6-phosphate isomerase [Intrasporangium calvum]ADU48205.1 glucose-6-phosphate isomerase [Intrasporangium calvum DSM 43043]AXG13266.1 glucose-6-phosphate isomerase [Intrasporangium calvum]
MTSLAVSASGAAADAVARHVPELVRDSVASRLFAQDAALWGPDAEAEARKRLSWVGLPRSSRPLVGEIAALRDTFLQQGLTHVVLCGMGGSSLAPEVICGTAGRPLVVLDSSDPDFVRRTVSDDLEHTVVVVSSKSGSTVETDSQRRAYEQAFSDAGVDPAERIVVITDPGSPLDEEARAKGYRVVNADPNVGGRYSALTAFGLVPSGLAGVDVAGLLDEAESVADLLAADDEANPALRLGAAMGGTSPLRDKLILVEDGSGIQGFADWAEQLIAESTGKDGTGVLPVVVESEHAPELGWSAPDVLVARLVASDDESRPDGDEVRVGGTLGAQLLLWEVATAVAGRLLGINPFDQPDVESAKQAARGLLDQGARQASPAAYVDGAVEVRALGGNWLSSSGDGRTVADAVEALLGQVTERGYVAVMAYLDRLGDAGLANCRAALAARTERPTTFGWGPRFLHSTGQFHKGGPAVGVYLQITSEPGDDLPVPGRDFTFGQFIAAQAGGDAQVLAEHGRPVLQLHLTDHDAGLAQVLAALLAGARR